MQETNIKTMVKTLYQRIRLHIENEKEYLKIEQQNASMQFTSFEVYLSIIISLSLCYMTFVGNPQLSFLYHMNIISISADYWDLIYLCSWTFASVIGYMLIPYIFMRHYKISLREYWSIKPFLKHWKFYILLPIPVLFLAYWVSHWSSFQEIYPFYRQAHRSWFDFLVWECAYLLQFLAVEFFFRAFILEGFRPSLGYAAIPIMSIPYCMIHFQKTAAESIASIIAAFVLGWLAMRSKSIWGGILMHWMVALSMDIMSLVQAGHWPPG